MSHELLEQQLREARSAFDGDPVSPDAWQDNQRRVAGSRPARRRHTAGWLAAATVTGIVAAGLGFSALQDDGPSAVQPASGPQRATSEAGPFEQDHLLGPPVVYDEADPDTQAVRRLALLDPDGNGPRLCAEYRLEQSSATSCHAREEDADKGKVAFDWLGGTSGDGSLRALIAGVDQRVDAVEVWLSNGRRQIVETHPSGWENHRLLAFSRTLDEGVPQRLVAYDADRQVLQAIDLPDEFGGAEWLPTKSACDNDPVVSVPAGEGPFPRAQVALGTSDVLVEVATTPSASAGGCLGLEDRPLAAALPADGYLVVVTAPEVSLLKIRTGDRTVDAEPTLAPGAPWALVRVALPPEVAGQDIQLTAYDAPGPPLDQRIVEPADGLSVEPGA